MTTAVHLESSEEKFFNIIGTMRFHQVQYQGIVRTTVSGVFEDLKFKISEGSDQN